MRNFRVRRALCGKDRTQAAFFGDDDDRAIQEHRISYVADFLQAAPGQKLNPHLAIGVGGEDDLYKMLADAFEPFAFSPTGASG